MGKGPGITMGGNIHPGLREHLVNIAKDYNIPFQSEIAPQVLQEQMEELCKLLERVYLHYAYLYH